MLNNNASHTFFNNKIVINGSVEKDISNNQTTTIKSESVPAGLYLVCAYLDLPISSNSVYNLGVNGLNTRTTGINGGGMSNVRLLSFNSQSSIYFTTYQETGNTIRLGLYYSIFKIA